MAKTEDMLSIKDWSLEDRPREKLRDKGSSVLSNAELLAILLGSGNKNETAVALSKRILGGLGNDLNKLGKATMRQLMDHKGIGEAKAITIMAAMELGKRRRKSDAAYQDKIESSNSVFNVMQPVLGDLPHEEFWIMFLNNANKVLKKHQFSKGGITGTLVDIRLVLKTALELGAVALILVHNHPSGTLKPSAADKSLTQKLKKASESLDIKILDHVIITEQSYFSFADDGLL